LDDTVDRCRVVLHVHIKWIDYLRALAGICGPAETLDLRNRAIVFETFGAMIDL
jgi:hypothetical protein